MDAAARSYVDELAARLRALLDPVGVSVVGSAALGAYVPGSSDLDVLVVARAPLSDDERRAVVARCSHEALPCPARKLELVVYGPGETIELNLNTGADDGTTTPGAEDFWFVLDRAQAREHALPLVGPPPAELLAPVPRDAVLEALRTCVAWYAVNEPGEATLLAAARAWRYAEEGDFASKRDAFGWAAARLR